MDLVAAYQNDKALRDIVYTLEQYLSFKEGWSKLRTRYTALHQFCGGLASIFPGSATVESDFSRLRRKNNLF